MSGELPVTREPAGKRGGGVSEEPDRSGIFSAVFAVSLRFCSKSSLTFNKNRCDFSYSSLVPGIQIPHLVTDWLLCPQLSLLLLLLCPWDPRLSPDSAKLPPPPAPGNLPLSLHSYGLWRPSTMGPLNTCPPPEDKHNRSSELEETLEFL